MSGNNKLSIIRRVFGTHRPSPKILHEHQLAATLIELRIQDRPVVGSETQDGVSVCLFSAFCPFRGISHSHASPSYT